MRRAVERQRPGRAAEIFLRSAAAAAFRCPEGICACIGQQIIFTEDLVLGYVGKPLHGYLSASDALSQLLAGTGLFVEHTSAGVMIRRDRHAADGTQDSPADTAAAQTIADQPEEV